MGITITHNIMCSIQNIFHCSAGACEFTFLHITNYFTVLSIMPYNRDNHVSWAHKAFLTLHHGIIIHKSHHTLKLYVHKSIHWALALGY